MIKRLTYTNSDFASFCIHNGFEFDFFFVNKIRHRSDKEINCFM